MLKKKIVYGVIVTVILINVYYVIKLLVDNFTSYSISEILDQAIVPLAIVVVVSSGNLIFKNKSKQWFSNE